MPIVDHLDWQPDSGASTGSKKRKNGVGVARGSICSVPVYKSPMIESKLSRRKQRRLDVESASILRHEPEIPNGIEQESIAIVETSNTKDTNFLLKETKKNLLSSKKTKASPYICNETGTHESAMNSISITNNVLAPVAPYKKQGDGPSIQVHSIKNVEKENVQTVVRLKNQRRNTLPLSTSSRRKQQSTAFSISSSLPSTSSSSIMDIHSQSDLVAWSCSYCTFENTDWKKRFCVACDQRRSITVQPIPPSKSSDALDDDNETTKNYDTDDKQGNRKQIVFQMTEGCALYSKSTSDLAHQYESTKTDETSIKKVATPLLTFGNDRPTFDYNSNGKEQEPITNMKSDKARSDTNTRKSKTSARRKKGDLAVAMKCSYDGDLSVGGKYKTSCTDLGNKPSSSNVRGKSEIGSEQEEASSFKVETKSLELPEESSIRLLSKQIADLTSYVKSQENFRNKQFQQLFQNQTNFFNQILSNLQHNEGQICVVNRSISTVEVSPLSTNVDKINNPRTGQGKYQPVTDSSLCNPLTGPPSTQYSQTQEPIISTLQFDNKKVCQEASKDQKQISVPLNIDNRDWNTSSQCLLSQVDKKENSFSQNDLDLLKSFLQFKKQGENTPYEKNTQRSSAIKPLATLTDQGFQTVSEDFQKNASLPLSPLPLQKKDRDSSSLNYDSGHVSKVAASPSNASPKGNSISERKNTGSNQKEKCDSKSIPKSSCWTSNVPSRQFVLELEDVTSKKKFSPLLSSIGEEKPGEISPNDWGSDWKQPMTTSGVPNESLLVDSTNNKTMTNVGNEHCFEIKENVSNNDKSFCMLADTEEPTYPYKETVRCKAKREGLPCYDCYACRSFYHVLKKTGHQVPSFYDNDKKTNDLRRTRSDNPVQNNNDDQFSRHRSIYPTTNTPPGYWELDFADELTQKLK